MKILALESSAKAASAALMEDGKLVGQYWQASALTHSKTLLKMAEDLLSDMDLTIHDVDAIAVAKGPGSFTGIRIGVAAAKGLAWGADKPIVGVSTLEAMAYHLADREDCIICCAMDARRGQIYNAKFVSHNDKLERLCPDRAFSLEEVMEEAKKDGKPYFIVGDGAELCYNNFLENNLPAKMAPQHLRLQSAWGVGMAATGETAVSPDDLVPNYLRISQAERERLAREKKAD